MMPVRLSMLWVVCAAFVTFILGCQQGPVVVQVDGLATRNKVPVPFLLVNFVPKEGRPSWGMTDEEGKFVLHYDQQREGAVTGTHKVFVVFRPRNPKEEYEILNGIKKTHPENRAILAKYGNSDTSPLQVEIKEAGQKVHLELD